ncbi:MAG TPA: PA14 domain-containing protein, partial [Chloroflexota bacterium]|nr:PA14 domain-containing protein [Chloroflexota bacterium]
IYINEFLVGEPTISFLSPRLKEQTPFSMSLLPLRDPVPTALFLTGEDAATVELIRQLYPNSNITPLSSPYGGPVLLYSILVQPGDIGAVQGISGHYQSSGSAAPVQQREQTVDFTWQQPPTPFPFTARWDGVLQAPDYGDYELLLKASSSAQLTLDEQTLAVGGQQVRVQLAQGMHRLQISATIESAQDAVQLLWRPPQAGALQVVPGQALFGPPVSANGLVGSYYANSQWSGPPALQRVDPQVSFKFHLLPVQPPFSIEWTGKVAAPTAGLYRFGTSAIDSSQIFIDNQLVVDNPIANEYREGTVDLTAGLHDIRVRYEGHTGNYRVELSWQPPGAARQAIPSGYLFPSGSLAAAEPLPALPTAAPSPAGTAEPVPTNSQLAKQLGVVWQTDLGAVLGPDSQPVGLGLDPAGNVYVADAGHKTLDKVSPDGKLLWAAGTPPGEQFGDLAAAAGVPDGGGLLLDAGEGWIYQFTPDGKYRGKIGGPSLLSYHPRGLSVAANGDIFLADTGGGQVIQLDPSGQIEQRVGQRGTGPGFLSQPTGVAVWTDLSVLALDATGGKILNVSDPSQRWAMGQNPTIAGPQLAVGPDGAVWATDTQRNVLLAINATGQPSGVYSAEGGLRGPSGIAAGAGYLVISEPAGKRVTKLALRA